MQTLVLLVLVILSTYITTHPVKDVKALQKETIQGFTKQAKVIPIPFKKCFKVKTDLQANEQYIQFKPTRISLNLLKKFSIKNQGSKISVLQQLRSPIIYKHSNLLVFNNYLLVFLAPKTVIILEQTTSGFQVKNKYKLPQLDRFDKFKVYKIGSKGLLISYNKKMTYLLSAGGFKQFYMKEPSTIVHLSALNQDQFYTAQFMKGIGHYKIDHTNNNIYLVKRITGNIIGLQDRFKYVVDISLQFIKQGVILVLDAELGLIQLQYQEGHSSNKAKVVVPHKSCQSFDTVQRSHIVLLCQNQGHSTIIQVQRQLNKQNQYHYKKLEPIYQANYLNDLHVTDSYFLAYSYKQIHAFWNTRKNKLPQMLQTQSQIPLLGLQTFTFLRKQGATQVYTVEGGVLNKYRLQEKAAELYAKSQLPISKTFTIFAYGSCQDIEQLPKRKDKVEVCRFSKTISLQIGEQEYPRQQDFGVSASIIGILVIVFLLVIWICLKKYKGLQKQARRVLKNYQNKRAKGVREI